LIFSQTPPSRVTGNRHGQVPLIFHRFTLNQIPVARSPMLLNHNSAPRVFDFTVLDLIHVIVDPAG
jgi:hypothetical protein